MRRSSVITNRGAFFGLLAALLFGASTPAAKILLNSASPQLIAGLLYLGSGIGLVAVRIAGARRAQSEAPLRGADWLWLGGATLTGGIAGPVLLVNGLAHATAATASLLLNLEGVATALIAWLAFREHTSRRMVVGMAVILVGAMALAWGGRPTFGAALGPLLIAGACVCWAIDNNLTRNISGGDPFIIAAIKSLSAGSINTAAGVFLLHDRLPGVRIAGLIALVGFFGYGLSLVCFVLALRHAGTARTGAYFSAAPFVGAILSIWLLHGAVDWRLGVAGLLMAIGVYLHLTEEHVHKHVHGPLEHAHAHIHDEHHRHEHESGAPPGEPHSHLHRHDPLVHSHAHYPDLHHRHEHDR